MAGCKEGSAGAGCGAHMCGGVSCFSSSSGGSGCSNCSNSCEVDCTGKCNYLCTGESFKEAQNFILHHKILQSDVATIAKYVNHEVDRHSKSITNTSFKIKEEIDNNEVLKIIQNLAKINFAPSTNTILEKTKATKSLMNSIIQQMKLANRDMVTGD